MAEPLDKELVLSSAREHVAHVRERISQETEIVDTTLQRKIKEQRGSPADEIVRTKLVQHFSDRLDQLQHLIPSPYFVRCDVCAEDGEEKTLYFSKFSFVEQSIFSWMTAAARLRFADIGETSFALPERGTWVGRLIRKDQFMIVHGKIVFLSSEAEAYGRTLVHQEKLSQQKAGFMLPEIVERMEKAQDDVIRAPAHGSFLIAGPAGSGKTTLALHRLAYLLQSPDTASQFEHQDMVVFVQDQGTQAYFSRLLPDLGIHNVHIITFGAWAIERLRLHDFTFLRRPNGVEEVIDTYEQQKCEAMRGRASVVSSSKNPASILRDVYSVYFDDRSQTMFEQQMKQKQLDRFDLTILLQRSLEEGPLTQTQEYFVQKKNFEVIRKQRDVPLRYSLIVVDEAQNYLPEQVSLLRSCVAEETKAMLYVGDLEQQVLLGTVRDWTHVGETFGAGQQVKLEKVYRNTKPILTYLQTLGFAVSIPEGLRDGAEVIDKACSMEVELQQLQALVASKDASTHIGILSPSSVYLDPLRSIFAQHTNVHVLTIHEAQGVEFECVCLVGVSDDFFQTKDLTEERLRIKKDLIYVGLTRAMDELYVFGRSTLSGLL